MFKFLKERSKPIADNIVANIIVWGAGLIISVIAARSSYLSGLPLYQAMLIGGCAVLILVLVWFFIEIIFDKHRAKKIKAAELDVQKRIEIITAQHEEETKSLKRKYQEDIRSRERAFVDLNEKIETLKKQVEDWNQYGWLVSIAEVHAQDIDHYVTLQRIERGDIQLHDGVPYVKFGIYVLNNSVLDVAVALEGGYIVFREQKLIYPIDVLNNGLRNVKFLTERSLTIEQRLTEPEANFIASSEAREDAIFYFNNLILAIKGCRQHPPIQKKRLDMNKGVTLHNEPVAFGR